MKMLHIMLLLCTFYMWKWVTTCASDDHNQIFLLTQWGRNNIWAVQTNHTIDSWTSLWMWQRDSSYSCVVCVWFEMLKMRLYKDDLMEINSKTKKQTNKQTNKNIYKNIEIMFKLAWDTPTFDNKIKIMVYNKCLTISLVESKRSISWFSVLTSVSSKWGLGVHQLIHVHVSVLASHYWNPSSLVADKRNYFPKKRNWRSSMESSPPQSTAHCNRILWGIDRINKGPVTLWPCHLH